MGGSVRTGRFLDAATSRLPAVVLGSTAAERLGIRDLTGSPAVYLGGQWFTVIGILDPVPVLANLDSAAFIGYDVAEQLFDTSRSPSTVHVRTTPEAVDAVEAVLAATANPAAPEEIEVSRPSDALAAREAVDDTLTALLLGLGGVALLVGGIGIANMMVVSVLERRSEIGVRRALGATKRHIRLQFLTEAVLLALLGGAAGHAPRDRRDLRLRRRAGHHLLGAADRGGPRGRRSPGRRRPRRSVPRGTGRPAPTGRRPAAGLTRPGLRGLNRAANSTHRAATHGRLRRWPTGRLER